VPLISFSVAVGVWLTAMRCYLLVCCWSGGCCMCCQGQACRCCNVWGDAGLHRRSGSDGNPGSRCACDLIALFSLLLTLYSWLFMLGVCNMPDECWLGWLMLYQVNLATAGLGHACGCCTLENPNKCMHCCSAALPAAAPQRPLAKCHHVLSPAKRS
jgi:hypothetical protein